MSYWNQNGKYEAEAEELGKLVPMIGAAGTLKGEVWRAAVQIYYDYFNNGWGNNWRAAAAFLITHVNLPNNIQEMLYMHANGNMGGGYDSELDTMLDLVIEQLRDIEDQPNNQDMRDFCAAWNVEHRFWDEQYDDEEYDDEEYDE